MSRLEPLDVRDCFEIQSLLANLGEVLALVECLVFLDCLFVGHGAGLVGLVIKPSWVSEEDLQEQLAHMFVRDALQTRDGLMPRAELGLVVDDAIPVLADIPLEGVAFLH